MSDPTAAATDEFTVVESIHVRHRNALLLRGQFTPIYTDYYLHLMQHGLRNPPDLDQVLKDLLACFTLHLVARPWAESSAWTITLRAPRVNFFVTGDSRDEAVTGRLFTDDVREHDRNLLYAQTTAPQSPEPRNSTVEITGKDAAAWIEEYYRQSEQRPGRAFRLADESFALVAAQPDCDLAWLDGLTPEKVAAIESAEETVLLETRRFRFHCGCTLDQILPILGSWRKRPDELFGNADHVNIQCPRCAARYRVTRDMI